MRTSFLARTVWIFQSFEVLGSMLDFQRTKVPERVHDLPNFGVLGGVHNFRCPGVLGSVRDNPRDQVTPKRE